MHDLTRLFRLSISATAAIFLLCASSLTLAAERITYYHTDALGSPVAATNEQGNIVWQESYEPYGERIKKQPSSTTNSRWYTGHPLDAETGLNYAGARYYDPVIGRFMGVDPKNFDEDDPTSFNRYSYVGNNPYRYTDPDGRARVTEGGGGPGGGYSNGGGAPRPGAAGGARIPASRPAVSESTKSEQTFQRAVTNTELEATRNTGLLRGGREGENFFTNSVPSDAKRAHQRLGLDGPLRDVRIEFRIKNDVEITGPRVAKPGQSGTPGGGREFSTNEPTKIEIIRVDPLRK